MSLSNLPVDPSDDALRARANALVNAAIDHAHQLLHGSPSMQMNVIKALAPVIGKAAMGEGKTESEEIAELRGELAALTEAITGSPRAS